MPARLRAASITAICMPKQMPKTAPCARARTRRADLALGAALAEAAGHQDAVDVFEEAARVVALEDLADSIQSRLTFTLLAMPPWTAPRSATCRRPSAGVLADDGDGDLAFGIADPLDDLLPARQVGLRRVVDAEGGSTSGRALRRDRPAARVDVSTSSAWITRSGARCRTGRSCALLVGIGGRRGTAGCRAGCRSSAAP
jgi:hypothetical protein